jgi:hypothetical protein
LSELGLKVRVKNSIELELELASLTNAALPAVEQVNVILGYICIVVCNGI